MKILLHSSKTMKPAYSKVHALTTPSFITQATTINKTLKTLNQEQIKDLMAISEKMAINVKTYIDTWPDKSPGSAAALTFRGDIYSGLSADKWNKTDAQFAQDNLMILSGLYGLLRPYDEIKPYRLEMGYKLTVDKLSLYKYWEKELADQFSPNQTYINLTSEEYFKTIRPLLKDSKVISPKFLTLNEKTKLPNFVTVHAKIARGSFANWLVINKVDDPTIITNFDLLNYSYDQNLSTPEEPVFICKTFGGLGLSLRLK